MLETIISLASGALGGVGAGKMMPSSSLGFLGNAVAGIAGGGLGGQLMGMLMPAAEAAAGSGSMDPMALLSSVAAGGVGGGVVMTVIGFIKKAMGK